jgi:hypothetical protein
LDGGAGVGDGVPEAAQVRDRLFDVPHGEDDAPQPRLHFVVGLHLAGAGELDHDLL